MYEATLINFELEVEFVSHNCLLMISVAWAFDTFVLLSVVGCIGAGISFGSADEVGVVTVDVVTCGELRLCIGVLGFFLLAFSAAAI